MKRNNEIDIVSVLKDVFAKKLIFAIFLTLFSTLGVIYALNQQKEYTSVVILAPEANSLGMGSSLSEIAGTMGLNLGSSEKSIDAIYPEIYPDIFASSDFIISLFELQVTPKDSTKSRSYYDHLKKDAKIPFYKKPEKWLMEKLASKDTLTNNPVVNPFRLTKEQDHICNIIRGNIGCQLNKGTNVITITATDIDPEIAAVVADTLQSRLQKYITQYRTKKARRDLEEAIKFQTIVKKKYEDARLEYSIFSDSHTDVVVESYKVKLEELENNMQLRYNEYTQAMQLVGQARKKIQEFTPAFTIIQQATVPIKPSSTPRSLMVLAFICFGFLVNTFYVLFIHKSLVKRFKKVND